MHSADDSSNAERIDQILAIFSSTNFCFSISAIISNLKNI